MNRPIRWITVVCVLGLTLAGRARAMDDWEVRHLLTRTGFGVAPEEYAHFRAMAYEDAVRELLDGVRPAPVSPLPAWAEAAPVDRSQFRNLTEPQRRERFQEIQREQRQYGQELKGWWIGEMLHTPSPLTERLTLLWSNHFTSSLQKVKSPQMMLRQHLVLRREALGNFKQMVHNLSRDPAMIVYLDNMTNRKGAANENYARELMELFTLGEGHYSEADVKDAARAFTGWHVNRARETFFFDRRLHDEGMKTVLGQTGPFDGDQVIEILFTRPEVATFVAEKFWREFISDQPDPAEVERLAGIFRDHDYAIRPLLEALLLSPAFRDPASQGQLVKSPVELLVGTARTLQLSVPEPLKLALGSRQMGQDLFDPPNVKGWPGGTAWIDSNTLLLRRQALQTMLAEASRVPPSASMPAGQGKSQKSTTMKKSVPASMPVMQSLSKAERELLMQAGRMKSQGLDRSQIAEKLRAQGHDPREVMRLAEKVRQGGVKSAAALPATPPAIETGLPGWNQAMAGEPQPRALLAEMLLPVTPAEGMPPAENTRQFVGALMLDPVYQLK